MSDKVFANSGEVSAKEDSCIGFKPAETRQKLMDMSEVKPLNQTRLVKKVNNTGVSVADNCYWSESEIFVDQVFDNRVVFAESNMHLHGAFADCDK